MLYKKIKSRTQEIKDLTKLGLIDPSWLRNIEMFEKFHLLKNQNVCIQCCYVFVAEDYGISWETVKKIVAKLSK